MPEPSTLVEFFGAWGLVVVVVTAMARTVWAYVRDSYLPARLNIQEKAADAQRRIADVVERMDLRIVGVESRLGHIETTTSAIQQDIAAIYEAKRMERPSRQKAGASA